VSFYKIDVLHVAHLLHLEMKYGWF